MFKHSCNYLRLVVSGYDYNSKQGNNQSKACDSMLFVDLMCVTRCTSPENAFLLKENHR